MDFKVKRALFLFLAFCLTAASFPFGAQAARAADSDFDVSYEISPDPMGPLGADARLKLTVKNTGATDITWVRVDISMAAPYAKKWNASPPIHPGASRTVVFDVPFTSADVDVGRAVSVTINNDGDPMQDGDKTFTFNIHSKNPFFIASTVTPAGPWYPGDTVNVVMSYRNEMTDTAATGVVTDAYLSKNGAALNNPPEVNQGVINPGQIKTLTYSYTFRDSDVGRIDIKYVLHGTMMGREYDLAGTMGHMDVSEPVRPTFHAVEPSSEPGPPEVKFTAELSADPLEIDAGDTVAFRLKVDNTGDDDILGFDIHNAEGPLDRSVDGIDSGDERLIIINREIRESCDVSFVVVGRTGDIITSKETNTVHITVREAQAALSAAASASEAEVTQALSAGASEAAQPASSEAGTPDILYLLIAILALVIIAGIIVIVVLTGRKKE